MKNEHGFTLAELLIVIAIISVLVVISIPIYGNVQKSTRRSADLANIRAAKVAALTEYATDNESQSVAYYYDASSGKVKTTGTSISGYGKSTEAVDGAEGIPNQDGMARVLYVIVNQDESVEMKWIGGGLDSSHTITLGNSTYNAMSYIVSLTKGNLNGTIDSTTNSDRARTIKKTLNTSFGDVKTWMVSSRETKNSNKLVAWVTDVDLTTVTAGTWVRVIRYNTNKNPATYTPCYVKTVRRNGTTSIPEFGTIAIGQVSGSSQYYKAIAPATSDYDSAVKTFNDAARTQ